MDEHSGGARPPAEPLDPLAVLCAAHGPVNSAGHFPPGTIFGDWCLTAFIGRGGNGEVYCAEHVTLGTSAAVKVLIREEERAKARFIREAKLLSPTARQTDTPISRWNCSNRAICRPANAPSPASS